MAIASFLDTNIWVYAAAGRIDAPQKHAIASDLIGRGDFGLSAQVLAEFYSVTRGKREKMLEADAAERWLDAMAAFPVLPVDAGLVRLGVAAATAFRISYWDGAIVAAATLVGAPVLYTEDLNHGQSYGAVRVVNPFLPLPAAGALPASPL